MLKQRERVIVQAAAEKILAAFRLSPMERAEEIEALTEALGVAVDGCLENLEHLRVTR